MSRLLVAFILIPVVELFLLIEIGKWMGVWATIALILVTGIVGAALARSQGLAALARAQRQLERGEVPADSLLDGIAILVAGILLITPGVLTDTIGFVLLIAPLRRRLGRAILRRLATRFVMAGQEPEAAWEWEHTVTWEPTPFGPPFTRKTPSAPGEATEAYPVVIDVEADDASRPAGHLGPGAGRRSTSSRQ